MTGEERLNEFIEAIDSWIESKYVHISKPRKEAPQALNFQKDTLRTLTTEECAFYAYELYAYAEYIETLRAKENAVLEWADSSIWYIISTVMNQYGTQHTKWQEKYYSAVRENPLASQILKVKNHADARVKILNGKADRIQSMAQILNNLSKRR